MDNLYTIEKKLITEKPFVDFNNFLEKQSGKNFWEAENSQKIYYLNVFLEKEINKDEKLDGNNFRKSIYITLANLAISFIYFILLPIFEMVFYIIRVIVNAVNYISDSDYKFVCKLLKLTKFLHSRRNYTEVFEPIFVDWQEEYFEALFKKENWKARWINVRYTYAFLAAMWQKSPIGDLIEFVVKIAKG